MLTYEELTGWSYSDLIELARDFEDPEIGDYDFDAWSRSDIIEFILDNISE